MTVVWNNGLDNKTDIAKGLFGEARPLVCMYVQCDGYPTGHLAWLKETFNGGHVIIRNGIRGACPEYFNGMECLAAYLVHKAKIGIGGVYLYPLTVDNETEFNYQLYPQDDDLWVLVSACDEVLYDGSLKDAAPGAIEKEYYEGS